MIFGKYVELFKNKVGSDVLPILNNIGWLTIFKVLQIILGVVLSGKIGQYLGTVEFGTFNYALAYVALFNMFTSLGLQGIVVREVVQQTKNKDEILGTTFILKMAGGVVGVAIIVLSLLLVKQDSLENNQYIIIAAAALLFHSFSTIDLWFQSQTLSKYVVYSKGLALLFSFIVYILLIITKQRLITFVFVAVAEIVVSSVGLVIAYQKTTPGITKWTFSFAQAKSLVSQSWWLILSGIGAMINLKIDQIMIGEISGLGELGLYSAAVRVSEAGYFIPSFIALSVFPAMLKIKATETNRYQLRLLELLKIVVWLGISVAISGTIFSSSIINILYGESYQKASSMLAIHVWASVFIFMGEILSKWLIAEGYLEFSPIRHGLGAILNVCLNLIMVPTLGGIGAAISTVISYTFSSYIACFLYPKTRPFAKNMTLALVHPFMSIFRLFAR